MVCLMYYIVVIGLIYKIKFYKFLDRRVIE